MKNNELLAEISNKVIEIFGIYFQPNQFDDLERRVVSAAKELNINTSIENIYKWLSESKLTRPELNALSTHLTINETYFFRESPAIDLFIQKIIPDIINERRGINEKIRIWSAGCSSGEEPYSLAMILKEYFPELSTWDITILATDISPIVIQKAILGEYTKWSFRESKQSITEKYFVESKKSWKISPEIKKMVTFSYLNLSKNIYPSEVTNTENMDVIFCRNVMMYFTPKIIHEVSNRLYNSLKENGWLITSQVELNDDYFSAFNRTQYNSGIFYHKSNKKIVKQKPIFLSTPISKQPIILKNPIKKTEIKTIEKRKLKNNSNPKTNTQSKEVITKQIIEVLHQKGEYKKCIENCKVIINEGKLSNDIFELLIKSYANMGSLIEEERQIKKILSDNKATPAMFYLYSSYLFEQNNLKESEIFLNKAIYQNHEHILSNLMLGEINIKKDKKQIAIKHYQKVIDILENRDNNEIVPESDGLTAGRIKEFAEKLIKSL